MLVISTDYKWTLEMFSMCIVKKLWLQQSWEFRINCISRSCEVTVILCCVFSNVSSNCLSEWMHNHIGCICLSFLHCEFLNVSSNCPHHWMHNHTCCILLAFLRCAFSYVSSNCLPRVYFIAQVALFLHFKV